MALVVLLRGVNVGGHRTLRPTAIASLLTHPFIANARTARSGTSRRVQPV